MSLQRRGLLVVAMLCIAVSANASHTRRGPTAGHRKSRKAHAAAVNRPRAIDDGRATEIQTALVKAGYLPSVSGHWDASSQTAMQKLQSDNGWQTKLIPDSRALIKLGLGPGDSAEPSEKPSPLSAVEAGRSDLQSQP